VPRFSGSVHASLHCDNDVARAACFVALIASADPPTRERYAALLTLAVNCALCGANPFLYFTDLFDRLAAGWPKARAADLMPQAWLAAQQRTEKVESEAGLGVIHD